MKYVIVIGDGMSDFPIEALQCRTPLEAAEHPAMDRVASNGEFGLVRTIPAGTAPGSDTGNLSIMGYDPSVVFTGRSPLEAVSLGVEMDASDVAFRCNIVTLTHADDFKDRVMVSHSASGITDDEARELLEAVKEEFKDDNIEFTFGALYRHVAVIRGRSDVDLHKIVTHAPHDNPGKRVGDILPEGELSEVLSSYIERSIPVLEKHPVNLARAKNGLGMGNSIWFWGEGRKPALEPITTRANIRGSVISAVPLIHGICQLAGLSSIYVDGATADKHTNYIGKANAALSALEAGDDLVVVHIEAPDECGHDADVEGKVYSIGKISEEVLKPIMDGLTKNGEEYRILLMPDHGTMISSRTHDATPVPYAIYDSRRAFSEPTKYNERNAEKTGVFEGDGYKLIYRLLEIE